ncbi:hypothetical protein NIES4072_47290 [Nostoc commune NIES-4072]|uniref:Uncharacterized protein n=1 Tax=Nostoc commune NIES-4072 TaxID=2005467 RepID=A0A2R5FQL4_NOSCO|nr:hypothetical protein [Nostoc commune]BBD67959.1 hypothetical protein NIES4070_43540 [Nostoc commune HK-02]GBG21047.1 hypothetical protein NIES4072_47290 [Nostoc commune NIES-4072]
MAKTLISASGSGPDSNCGYSGTVPSGQEWYTVLVDNVWGAQGEHLVGTSGQTVTVTRCHSAGNYIGVANGQNFHFMRIYSVSAESYDCINGVCTLSTQYKTQGIYRSLADCQGVCANGGACAEGKKCVDPTTFCPDGKVCLDQGEFASIEALISKIGSEVC